MTDNYQSPCDTCTVPEKSCKGKECEKWRTRYLYRQKQINAYARRIGVMPEERGYSPGQPGSLETVGAMGKGRWAVYSVSEQLDSPGRMEDKPGSIRQGSGPAIGRG